MLKTNLPSVLRKLFPPRIHLPTPSEIVTYVTFDQQFLNQLLQAAQITRDQGREASLELQIDLVEGKSYLSEVGVGTEKTPGPVKNTHPYAHDQYIRALYLHSHPSSSERGFVCPSGSDLITTLATLSRNTEKLVKLRKIKHDYLCLQENIRIAHHVLKWTHHEAVIGVDEHLNVGMVLYENNVTIFTDKGPEREFHPKTQQEVMDFLRVLGFNARFFQYSLGGQGKYTVHEEYPHI